jgi:hypothetical protein
MSEPKKDKNQDYARDKSRLLTCWLVTGVILVVAILLLNDRIGYLQHLLEQSKPPQSPEGFWASTSPRVASVVEDLACGLFLAGCVAFVIKIFHFENAPAPDLEKNAIFTSRVARLFEKWSEDIPDSATLDKLLIESNVVEMFGITFYHKLIEAEEFPQSLRQRLSDTKKTTRILLLDPNGTEMNTRNAAHPTRQILQRAKLSHEILEQVAKDFPKKKFYYTFDYASTFTMLRFDKVVFVNLQLLAKCPTSPGLELQESGWLFGHYEAEFDRAWRDALTKTQSAKG